MIDYTDAEYEQIEAKAAEMARQFWAEIEEGLAQQHRSQHAATRNFGYTDLLTPTNPHDAASERNPLARQ